MWLDISILVRGFSKTYFLEGLFLKASTPSSSSTKVNSVYFKLELGYSVKFPVYLSLCIFHYFLKKENNLFWNFAGTFSVYYSGGLSACNCFYTGRYPQRSFFGVFFAHVCKINTFVKYLHILTTIELDDIKFFTLALGIILRVTSLNLTFLQVFSFCWVIFWGNLALILGYVPLFLESFSILFYEILFRCFFYILWQSMS